MSDWDWERIITATAILGVILSVMAEILGVYVVFHFILKYW